MMRSDPLPETCGIAFKEWAGVCDAIATGRQSLVLRKGGIAEGPDGFVPEHSVFWLYPTHVHEGEQGLRLDASNPPRPPGDPTAVDLQTLVVVESLEFVKDEETLLALKDFHVWTDETVAKRFFYRKPGLWVLGVRAYRSETPARIPVTPAQLGCKTWVPLDSPLGTSNLTPVLDVEESARRLDRIRTQLHSDR